MVYCAYCHSTVNYGIFWGNSPLSINIFRLQKKAVRIITNTRNRDSCTDLFKAPNIHLLQSHYIFSLVCFVAMIVDHYKVNLDIHGEDIRQGSKLHQTTSKLSHYLRGTYCMGIKIFSSLSFNIKYLSLNIKQFKWVLRNFFYSKSPYTLDEYFNYSSISDLGWLCNIFLL